MAWNKRSFAESADLIRDVVQPNDIGNIPYIGLEHISQGQLSLMGFGYSDEVVSAKFRFRKGDILFGKLRPYFRKVIIAPFDGVCSTDIWVIRAKPGMDQRFLFYWVASTEFIDAATRASEGTKMPRAKWEFVERIEKFLPEEDEQRAIAEVLGSLDDKIALNRRMNQTLEALAQAVFREWFVESEEVRYWDIGRISNFAQVTSGKRPENRQDKANSEYMYPIFGGGGIMAYTNGFLYNSPILLTGRVGTLGLIFRITDPCWASDNTLVIISSKPEFYFYLYFFLKQADLLMLNRGSTQPLLTQSDLQKIEMPMPPENRLIEFTYLVSPMFARIDANTKESRTLAELRDALLPKLMSGEVKVGNLDPQSGLSG